MKFAENISPCQGLAVKFAMNIVHQEIISLVDPGSEVIRREIKLIYQKSSRQKKRRELRVIHLKFSAAAWEKTRRHAEAQILYWWIQLIACLVGFGFILSKTIPNIRSYPRASQNGILIGVLIVVAALVIYFKTNNLNTPMLNIFYRSKIKRGRAFLRFAGVCHLKLEHGMLASMYRYHTVHDVLKFGFAKD